MSLRKKTYKNRVIDNRISEQLKTFPAICLEGPKYCGKTWTALNHSNSAIYLGDPSGDFQNRTMAKLDNHSVLKGDIPRLVDEWQEVPSIWDAVRFDSDSDNRKGKFILTGSSTPMHKGILHSGTGRINKIRMSTMALYETGDSEGSVSLEDLFNEKFEAHATKEMDLNELIYLTIRGGWPSNIGLSEKRCIEFAKSYLTTAIEDDIYRVDEIKRNHNKIRLLTKSLARNESTIVNNATLIKDIKESSDEIIRTDTLNEYLDILKRLFLIEEQPSFSTNFRSSLKIGKKPKRHFVDTSLAIASLGLTKEMLKNDLKTFGFIFETFCYHDLKVYAESFGASVYHYRDKVGREIDMVIQLSDGRWGAFEIKLGNAQIDEAANNLIKLRDVFSKSSDISGPSILVVISGQSNFAYTREDGVMVIPIYALKN